MYQKAQIFVAGELLQNNVEIERFNIFNYTSLYSAYPDDITAAEDDFLKSRQSIKRTITALHLFSYFLCYCCLKQN